MTGKIKVQPEIIGVHVVKEIDLLAFAALDGIVRAVAVVELLDTSSLAWLHQRLVEAEKGTTGLHGVLSAMRDIITSELTSSGREGVS